MGKYVVRYSIPIAMIFAILEIVPTINWLG